jgi:hypothetical protein
MFINFPAIGAKVVITQAIQVLIFPLNGFPDVFSLIDEIIGNFMIDFLEDHHESNADNIIIQLFAIVITMMAEMA